MTSKHSPGRDAFTFSLGGVTTITSVVPANAVAHDRINNAISARLGKPGDEAPDAQGPGRSRWGRFWLSRRHQPA